MPALNPMIAASRSLEYENLLAKLFQRAGWRVERQPQGADMGIDLIAQNGSDRYAIQLKVSSEARKDRAVPLMSQAILEAQAAARRVSGGAIPVAVLAVDHVSESLAKQVKQFAERNAPNVAIGLIDAEGFRDFAGHGLGVVEFGSVRFGCGKIGGEAGAFVLFVFRFESVDAEDTPLAGHPRIHALRATGKLRKCLAIGRGRGSLGDECLPFCPPALA